MQLQVGEKLQIEERGLSLEIWELFIEGQPALNITWNGSLYMTANTDGLVKGHNLFLFPSIMVGERVTIKGDELIRISNYNNEWQKKGVSNV